MRYRIVTAFFHGRAQADHALAELVRDGVPREAISVLPKEVGHLDDLGVKVASKVAEGAALGAAAGGLFGAAAGATAAAGSLVIPGLSTVIAGPFVSALAGAGAAGAIGMLAGALLGTFVPEFEAGYLDDAIGKGGSLVAVRCLEAGALRTEDILAARGGQRIRVRAGS
jgi:hypothetical protein